MLGLGITIGSILLFVPQIAKIYRAKSAKVSVFDNLKLIFFRVFLLLRSYWHFLEHLERQHIVIQKDLSSGKLHLATVP